jgi:hypothetical protein
VPPTLPPTQAAFFSEIVERAAALSRDIRPADRAPNERADLDVALQVAFERQTLKPAFSLDRL